MALLAISLSSGYFLAFILGFLCALGIAYWFGSKLDDAIREQDFKITKSEEEKRKLIQQNELLTSRLSQKRVLNPGDPLTEPRLCPRCNGIGLDPDSVKPSICRICEGTGVMTRIPNRNPQGGV